MIIDELKDWTEARSYCRQKYRDLATIEDMEDMRTLNDMAASMGKNIRFQEAWIGLHHDVNTWRWSMSDSDFYQHQESEFRSWAAGEPDNYGGQEYCGAMNFDGYWADKSCSNNQSTICLQVSGSNVSFVHIKTYMNWTEALSYCRKHHTDLASIRNLDENRKVNNTIPKDRVWIGLYRDTWKWADANNSTFRNWNKENNEPNSHGKEECAAANFGRSGQWEDWNCGERKSFICYSGTDVKFVYISLKMNWTKAQSYCSKHYTGLAYVRNIEENQKIKKLIPAGQNPWIGLSRFLWIWADGSQSSFRHWSSGEPSASDKLCAIANLGNSCQWEELGCNELRPFVCYKGQSNYCRDHHTDLATLENMEDVRMLADLGASLANSPAVWIGLYADVNSWKWSISDGDQQEEKQFWNWYTGEPNNQFGRESCAAIDIDGSWYDVPCSLTLGTLCVEEKETRKFWYNNQERTWSEAQSYCRERYTDLANIRDTSENQKIKNLITQPVWMGLYQDPWKWVEGRKSSFRFWNIFNPDSRKNECVAANFGNGGKWEKWSCAEKKAFICSAGEESCSSQEYEYPTLGATVLFSTYLYIQVLSHLQTSTNRLNLREAI
ncbi:PREDICTED: macrophage mannose receptor 1-like, partial [Cyprinodon variegatus]|uniref:macrophage mannose receptor 1-like n=1 Tax=Cyprinodon variegatus TaxID=28743 RepID=UPI0007426FB5